MRVTTRLVRPSGLPVAALLISMTVAASSLDAGPPRLRFPAPSALRPGEPTDVTFHGEDLQGAKRIWTSFAAACTLAPDVEKNATETGRITYRIEVPADTEIGVGGVRIASQQGVSNLLFLMIDDLATIEDGNKNGTIEAAQQITVPIAIDGTCERSQLDFYRFTARAGERIAVEVVAQRLGSKLDPVIRLLRETGKEIACSDDDPGIGSDCRFSHTFAKDGSYIVEIRDNAYKGGADHRYRLRIGDFPLPTVPYPLGIRAGEKRSVVIIGSHVEGIAPRQIEAPASTIDRPRNLTVRFPGGKCSSWVQILASDLENVMEIEPNDRPEEATPSQMPAAFNGRFEKPKDRDHFRFEAKKGERVLFVGKTRRLGSPTDLFFRLFDAAGNLLKEAEDVGTDEGRFDHTFPADGTYCLMVENLDRRGGPEHAYRVEARPFVPGFALRLESEKFDAPQHGVLAFKVLCDRQGFDGEVTLSLEGAGSGLELSGHVIGAKKKDTILRARLPPRWTSGELISLQIVGAAKVGEAEVRRVASTLGALRKAYPGTPFPPPGLDRSVGVGIRPPFEDFFAIRLAPAEIVIPRFSGDVAVKVIGQRLVSGFKDPIRLAVDGLPEGLVADVKPIPKNKTESVLTLKAPGGLAVGTHEIVVRANGVFQNQPKERRLEKVVLRVVDPVRIVAIPAGDVKPGKEQKIKVSVLRRGAKAAPVTLRWKKLPAGIQAPEQIVVAAEKSDVEIEIKAAGNLPPGSFHELVLVAEIALGEHKASVESAAFLVKVAEP